jgi:hypothetical protein
MTRRDVWVLLLAILGVVVGFFAVYEVTLHLVGWLLTWAESGDSGN